MTKKEKLLKELREICREYPDTMDIICTKALYLYTSLKNLQQLKMVALHEVQEEKKYKEEQGYE